MDERFEKEIKRLVRYQDKIQKLTPVEILSEFEQQLLDTDETGVPMDDSVFKAEICKRHLTQLLQPKSDEEERVEKMIE